MKQTDVDTDMPSSARLAGALFDEVVVPLAQARRAAGAEPYFARAGDATLPTYFTKPELGRMQPSDFELPGGGTAEGLIEALAAHWSAQGEPALTALAPHLKAIAQALAEEAGEGDGSVDVLCYTLF